jgi:hypothetical protein
LLWPRVEGLAGGLTGGRINGLLGGRGAAVVVELSELEWCWEKVVITRSAPVPSYCICSVSSAWARDERDELGEGEKRATTAASENQLDPGPAPVPVPHAHGQADPASCWVQRREKVAGCWYGISAGTSSAYFFCQLEPELKANQKWPAAPTCTPVCLQIADFRSQVTVHRSQVTVHSSQAWWALLPG